jgi:tartrate dehydrogenase/decarboxylase/D-malate dehydrogenase
LIDAIPGDGIGVDVTESVVRAVDTLAETHGFSVTWRERDWNSELYRRTGRMMPVDGIEQLADGDATFLGAVGTPDVPDDVTLWGLLIPIRREFDQYVNLRPMRLLPGVTGSQPGLEALDVVVVRENVEGEYSTVGGRFGAGEAEAAIQEAIFTRAGISRVARYAAELAQRRGGTLVSATKSNGIIHTMPFWDEVVADSVAEHAPDVHVDKVLIDALAARAVMKPTSLSTIVASNLFGDILSDLVAGVAGSIGIAPSGNLNPEHRYPSMFEPVHGSAPDIAGQGIANPVGALWAASMMLEHLGEASAAAALTRAFEAVLAAGTSTPDLGGTATTASFTSAVIERLRV